MATETPAAPAAPAAPPASDYKTELASALEKGFALKAAGKMYADDPDPQGIAPAQPSQPAPQPKPPEPEPEEPASPTPDATAKSVVPPKPTKPETLEQKRKLTAQQWEEVNKDRAQLRDKLSKLEAERSQWEQAKSAVDEAKRLKTERDEYDRILREVAAERHPDLIGPINKKVNDAVELAKMAVPAEQREAVAALLRQPESDQRDDAIENVLEGLSTMKRNRLIRAIQDVDVANRERSQLAQHSQQMIEQRQKEAQMAMAKAAQEFDAELNDWTNPENGVSILTEKSGDLDHNTRRASIVEQAKAIFNGKLTPREVSRAAIWASLAPALMEQAKGQASEIDKLRARITELEGGGPKPPPTAADEAAPTDEKPQGMSLAEWVVKRARDEGIPIGR